MPGTKRSTLHVKLREPSDVLVKTGSAFARGLGLALLIGGGAVFGVGAFTLYLDAKLREGDQYFCAVDASRCYSSPDWVIPVGIAGGVGLGAALVGLGIYIAGQPSVKASPRRAAAATHRRETAARSRFVFAPELGPQHAGMRLGVTF